MSQPHYSCLMKMSNALKLNCDNDDFIDEQVNNFGIQNGLLPGIADSITTLRSYLNPSQKLTDKEKSVINKMIVTLEKVNMETILKVYDFVVKINNDELNFALVKFVSLLFTQINDDMGSQYKGKVTSRDIDECFENMAKALPPSLTQ